LGRRKIPRLTHRKAQPVVLHFRGSPSAHGPSGGFADHGVVG
jgi:hypothetical protein